MSSVELSQIQNNAIFYGGIALSGATIITGVALFILAMNGNYFYGAIACWGVGVSAASFAIMLRCCVKPQSKANETEKSTLLTQTIQTQTEDTESAQQERDIYKVQLSLLQSNEAATKKKIEDQTQLIEQLQKELKTALIKRIEETFPHAASPKGTGTTLSYTQAVWFFYQFEMQKAIASHNHEKQTELKAQWTKGEILDWTLFVESSSFKELIQNSHLGEPFIDVKLPESLEDLPIAFEVAYALKHEKLIEFFSAKMATHLDQMAKEVHTKEYFEGTNFSFSSDTKYLTFVIPRLFEPFALLGVEKDHTIEDSQHGLLEDKWLKLTKASQIPIYGYGRDDAILKDLIQEKGNRTWKQFYFAKTLGTLSDKDLPLSALKQIGLFYFGSFVTSLRLDLSFEKRLDTETMKQLDQLLMSYVEKCPHVRKIKLQYLTSQTHEILPKFNDLKELDLWPLPSPSSEKAQFPLDVFKSTKIETFSLTNVTATLKDLAQATKFCPTLKSISIWSFDPKALPADESLVLDSLTFTRVSSFPRVLTSLNSKNVIVRELVMHTDTFFSSDKGEQDNNQAKSALKESSIMKIRMVYRGGEQVEFNLKDS